MKSTTTSTTSATTFVFPAVMKEFYLTIVKTYYDYDYEDDGSLKVVAMKTLLLACVMMMMMMMMRRSFLKKRLFFSKKNNIHRMTLLLPVAPTTVKELLTRLVQPHAPQFLLELSKRTGKSSFRLPLPWPMHHVYVLGDDAIVKAVLMDDTTEKPPCIYQNVQSYLVRPNIVSSPTNSEYWYHVRKTTRHAFSKNEVNRMNDICIQHMERWMKEEIDQNDGSTMVFDPSETMTSITLQTICEAGFEYILSHDELQKVQHHNEVIGVELRMRMCNPLRRLFSPFVKSWRTWNPSGIWLEQFMAHILEAYRQNPNKSKNRTVIRLLNDCSDLTDQQRIDEMIAFFVAGFDTTGFTMGSILYLLAQHPHVATKLRQELLLSSKTSPDQVEYFQHVLKEGMRLLPVAAMFPFRVTGRDFWTQDDVFLPKGSLCILAQIVANYNPDVYQDHPTEFRPERWQHATTLMKESLRPFAIGSRNCIGQALARAELNAALPLFLKNYELEVVQEGQPEYFLTMKICGAKLRAKKISSSSPQINSNVTTTTTTTPSKTSSPPRRKIFPDIPTTPYQMSGTKSSI